MRTITHFAAIGSAAVALGAAVPSAVAAASRLVEVTRDGQTRVIAEGDRGFEGRAGPSAVDTPLARGAHAISEPTWTADGRALIAVCRTETTAGC